MADNGGKAPATSFWMNVDLFTVEQAAALWIDVDPASVGPLDKHNPSEYSATKQMLTAGILTGELNADTSTNGLRMIGDHSKSLVARADLEAFAKNRNLFPAFLFDTLAPFQRQHNPVAAMSAINQPNEVATFEITPSANRGGRPAQYDWDSFTMEIIRRANHPDGLPEKQAYLVRDMLSWFQSRYRQEPAESAVKSRISKIYRYLDEAKNLDG